VVEELFKLLNRTPEELFAVGGLVAVIALAYVVYKLVGRRNGMASQVSILEPRISHLEQEMAATKATLAGLSSISAELQRTSMRLVGELGTLRGILQDHTKRMNGRDEDD